MVRTLNQPLINHQPCHQPINQSTISQPFQRRQPMVRTAHGGTQFAQRTVARGTLSRADRHGRCWARRCWTTLGRSEKWWGSEIYWLTNSIGVICVAIWLTMLLRTLSSG